MASKVIHPADSVSLHTNQPLQQHGTLLAPRDEQSGDHTHNAFEDSDIMVCFW
jgi:hypothetical protein